MKRLVRVLAVGLLTLASPGAAGGLTSRADGPSAANPQQAEESTATPQQDTPQQDTVRLFGPYRRPKNGPPLSSLSRRNFLKGCLAAGSGAAIGSGVKLWALEPVDVANPLAAYPQRDWEEIYRNQYGYESTFSWVCSPNDTHFCRCMAYVRNGVITRLGSEYNNDTYADLYGNHATAAWNPRQCAKGYTFHRIVYGPYRIKHPMVRQGWKQWADDGFPYLTPELRTKYKFDARGQDQFLKIAWEDAFAYIAKGFQNTAQTYSGPQGAQRLLDEGYAKEMVDEMGEAGTRTFKFRGGMGLLGVIGKYGIYRLNNSMALLDAKIRGVGPDFPGTGEARGGRNFSNYTWHGDQAPGHPWVHGLQTSDCDFNDLRFSKLIIMDGKNLVENKMADSHWFIECMERGAKIVVIAPEYGPPSTKADYWISIRPQTDAALFLGITRVMMDNKWYDEAFVKQFTDFPLLVRTDNLKRLRAHEIFPNYQSDLSKDGPSYKIQGFTDEQHEQLGDYVVWDRATNGPKAITRDDVGTRLEQKGIDPVLEGRFRVNVGGQQVEVMTLFEMYKVHLADYDLKTVSEITNVPQELIERLDVTPGSEHLKLRLPLNAADACLSCPMAQGNLDANLGPNFGSSVSRCKLPETCEPALPAGDHPQRLLLA